MQKLKFGKGNAKLDKNIYTFSLPAGYTCPGAKLCLSRANIETGQIKDGEHTEFRCFAASQESLYKNVRESRWHNFDALRGKSTEDMAWLILESLPKKAQVVRVHVSGDFFSAEYLRAWILVAKMRPGILFYGYTKSLVHFTTEIENARRNGYNLPDNFRFTASYGGKNDELIAQYGLSFSRVVYSQYEARKLGLKIDHDDSLCMAGKESFALLVHGVQPGGTKASKARQRMLKRGWAGYRRQKSTRLPLEVIL